MPSVSPAPTSSPLIRIAAAHESVGETQPRSRSHHAPDRDVLPLQPPLRGSRIRTDPIPGRRSGSLGDVVIPIDSSGGTSDQGPITLRAMNEILRRPGPNSSTRVNPPERPMPLQSASTAQMPQELRRLLDRLGSHYNLTTNPYWEGAHGVKGALNQLLAEGVSVEAVLKIATDLALLTESKLDPNSPLTIPREEKVRADLANLGLNHNQTKLISRLLQETDLSGINRKFTEVKGHEFKKYLYGSACVGGILLHTGGALVSNLPYSITGFAVTLLMGMAAEGQRREIKRKTPAANEEDSLSTFGCALRTIKHPILTAQAFAQGTSQLAKQAWADYKWMPGAPIAAGTALANHLVFTPVSFLAAPVSPVLHPVAKTLNSAISYIPRPSYEWVETPSWIKPPRIPSLPNWISSRVPSLPNFISSRVPSLPKISSLPKPKLTEGRRINPPPCLQIPSTFSEVKEGYWRRNIQWGSAFGRMMDPEVLRKNWADFENVEEVCKHDLMSSGHGLPPELKNFFENQEIALEELKDLAEEYIPGQGLSDPTQVFLLSQGAPVDLVQKNTQDFSPAEIDSLKSYAIKLQFHPLPKIDSSEDIPPEESERQTQIQNHMEHLNRELGGLTVHQLQAWLDGEDDETSQRINAHFDKPITVREFYLGRHGQLLNEPDPNFNKGTTLQDLKNGQMPVFSKIPLHQLLIGQKDIPAQPASIAANTIFRTLKIKPSDDEKALWKTNLRTAVADAKEDEARLIMDNLKHLQQIGLTNKDDLIAHKVKRDQVDSLREGLVDIGYSFFWNATLAIQGLSPEVKNIFSKWALSTFLSRGLKAATEAAIANIDKLPTRKLFEYFLTSGAAETHRLLILFAIATSLDRLSSGPVSYLGKFGSLNPPLSRTPKSVHPYTALNENTFRAILQRSFTLIINSSLTVGTALGITAKFIVEQTKASLDNVSASIKEALIQRNKQHQNYAAVVTPIANAFLTFVIGAGVGNRRRQLAKEAGLTDDALWLRDKDFAHQTKRFQKNYSGIATDIAQEVRTDLKNGMSTSVISDEGKEIKRKFSLTQTFKSCYKLLFGGPGGWGSVMGAKEYANLATFPSVLGNCIEQLRPLQKAKKVPDWLSGVTVDGPKLTLTTFPSVAWWASSIAREAFYDISDTWWFNKDTSKIPEHGPGRRDFPMNVKDIFCVELLGTLKSIKDTWNGLTPPNIKARQD